MGRHALLSASSSKRWLSCTPSARLEEQFQDEPGGSVYAEEGTAAHALAEHKLKKALKRRSNANFERTCLSKYFGRYIPPESWHCSAVQAAMLALPRSLEDVGRVLGLDEQKMKEGKELIRYFCVPCKPTKANGGRTRNLPCHAPEKWELFKTYCKRDVDVEKSIRRKLHNFPIPESEMELYRLDQRINDRGVLVDMGLVKQAISCERLHKEVVTKRAYELTGLENPNSVAQLKGWLGDMGMEAESLSKKAVAEMIAETDGEVEELLKIRLLMAKTSVKKYEAMERSVCSDGRVHGMLMFCGANRTARWSGKIVQIQNLPKNYIPDLELARELVKQGRFEDIELLYDSTPNVLSELIRTAFIPKPGCRFVVADFSAIEARVLAWLSGEQWRLDVFTSHGKIYEASASAMFHVPMEEITKTSPLRQKGKLAELVYEMEEAFRVPVRMTEIAKSELITGGAGLDCEVAFTATGLFYKNVSGYSGTLSIGGKIYPYEYTYAYADVTQNTLMIDSDSHGDSPCRVTVYGPCTNPVWKHYVNNVLYETGKYEGSIPDGHKLVIDTTQIPYSITERGVSDEVVADRYQMCDFTTERFFHLQYGSNRISVVHEGLNILNVMVEGRISYETV